MLLRLPHSAKVLRQEASLQEWKLLQAGSGEEKAFELYHDFQLKLFQVFSLGHLFYLFMKKKVFVLVKT